MLCETGKQMQGLNLLERHGETVNGSSRASLHFWEVDTSKFEARLIGASTRQVSPGSKVMDVEKIAQEVARLTIDGIDDCRLAWSNDRQLVSINMNVVIPRLPHKQHRVAGSVSERLLRY